MPRTLKDCKSQDEVRAHISEGKLTEEDWKQMREVDVEIAPRKGSIVSIRFDEETTPRLRQLATKKGIGYTTLVRMWILERLESESRPDLKVSAGGRK